MYLSYLEYKEMGGVLDETAFLKYAYEARMKLSDITKKRICNVSDEANGIIKACQMRILEILAQKDEAILGKKVSGFSHDGLSESYSISGISEYDRKIAGLIDDFLGELTDNEGVPLLYRGCSK